MKKDKGFSLIELMAVIAIVGILSTVILGIYNSTRIKARDAKRLADMGQLQLALALYYSTCGFFPVCQGTVSDGNSCSVTGGSSICSTVAYQGDLLQLRIAPTFISSIPTDPVNTAGSNGYGYYYARGYKKISENYFCTTGRQEDYVMAARREGVTGNVVRSCSSCTNLTTCTGGTWNNNNLNYLIGN